MTKKEEILKNAKILISKEDITGMSMSQLAKKCNIAKATIYHYFKSKEEIYQNVLSSVIEKDYKEFKTIFSLEIENKEKIIKTINYFFIKNIIDMKIIDNELYFYYLKNVNKEELSKFNYILGEWNELIKEYNKNINSRMLFEFIKTAAKNYIYKVEINKLKKDSEIKDYLNIKNALEETKEDAIESTKQMIFSILEKGE